MKSGATATQAGGDAEATVKSAEATVGVDQAQIQADRVALSKIEIRAPFDGHLGAFSLSVGALVRPGPSIVGIAKVAPVHAEFMLPDSDLDLVRRAMAENRLCVEVRSSLAPETTPAETGPIVFIDNKIQDASASITFRAELPNEDLALWPGRSTDVKVEAGSMDDIVEVALRLGDQVGVASGLDPGETVVTEGQVNLRAARCRALGADRDLRRHGRVLGFSIDNISLLAVTLSVGLVVRVFDRQFSDGPRTGAAGCRNWRSALGAPPLPRGRDRVVGSSKSRMTTSSALTNVEERSNIVKIDRGAKGRDREKRVGPAAPSGG